MYLGFIASENSVVVVAFKSLVSMGCSERCLQSWWILTLAVSSPLSYQGRFVGWPNEYHQNGCGLSFGKLSQNWGKQMVLCFLEEVQTMPPSLTLPPFPFLPSSANVWSERARKWLCDRYLMTSLYWWVPPRGQDAVVRPLLKKSLFYDIFRVLVLSGSDCCSLLYWDRSLKFTWQAVVLSFQPTLCCI